MSIHNPQLRASSIALDVDRHSETLKSILAAVMIADSKIHRDELEEVISTIDTLAAEIASHTGFGSSRKWLQENVGEINKMIHGPNRDRWLALQFLKLRDFPDKESALDYLWRVAVADGELHINEAAIIDKALWLWKNR